VAEQHGQTHDDVCAEATGTICVCSCRGTLHGIKHRHGRSARVMRLAEVKVTATNGPGGQHHDITGAGGTVDQPTTAAARRRDPVVVTAAQTDSPIGAPTPDGPTVTHTVGATSTLPGDLTTIDDDTLMTMLSTFADQGRDDDVRRVWEEMGRREEASVRPPELPHDLSNMGDDALLEAISTHATDEAAVARVWEELGRREDAAAAAEARRAELATPPAEMAYVESTHRVWTDLHGSPIPGYGTADEETKARAQHAMRLAHGLGPDDTDAELYAAQQADDRPGDERIGWYIAWYRKLAALDGIQPGDPRYGPNDSPAARNLIEGRIAAREAAARERAAAQAAKDARMAKLAAGPAGPARVNNPMAAWGEVESGPSTFRGQSIGTDMAERIRLAKAKTLGLPDDADIKAIRQAEKTDPRSVPERAATYLAWYRLIGEAHEVKPQSPAWADTELGQPDDRSAPMRAPAIPADVPKSWDRWQEIKLAAKADMDGGDRATWDRYVMAMRRAYMLPDDAADYQVTKAHGADKRKPDEIAAAFIGEFRRLGAEAGIDPGDALRYGPPDRSTGKRKPVSQWRELTPEQDRQLEGMLARGYDYLDAYAAVHNLDPETLRAQQAAGTAGKLAGQTLAHAVRRQYDEWVHLQHIEAENATNGYMLSREGKAAGIDPVLLFSGPTATARKYASEELKRWWADNKRLTFTEFKAQVVGGRADKAAAARTRAASNGQDFI
jgi:hypothetical protein